MFNNKEAKVDWDYGFRHGRQWGRGRQGGQVQDERERESKEQEVEKPILGKRNYEKKQ